MILNWYLHISGYINIDISLDTPVVELPVVDELAVLSRLPMVDELTVLSRLPTVDELAVLSRLVITGKKK